MQKYEKEQNSNITIFKYTNISYPQFFIGY